MDHLPDAPDVPGMMELSLYDHQAAHLLCKLQKLLPVRLIPVKPNSEQNCTSQGR